jgi:hypothetical protein
LACIRFEGILNATVLGRLLDIFEGAKAICRRQIRRYTSGLFARGQSCHGV